ncbi:hypothetical protein T03_4443 [Trichinella britovi]|uniref:Uncharacterized protein n=1 Tax=Trichinella britovi TaxID=45882 RepID=A0A0V1B6V4_TRIBR|nr:hypothetical protein T03_4443 [Trichinella britovi]
MVVVRRFLPVVPVIPTLVSSDSFSSPGYEVIN